MSRILIPATLGILAGVCVLALVGIGADPTPRWLDDLLQAGVEGGLLVALGFGAAVLLAPVPGRGS